MAWSQRPREAGVKVEAAAEPHRKPKVDEAPLVAIVTVWWPSTQQQQAGSRQCDQEQTRQRTVGTIGAQWQPVARHQCGHSGSHVAHVYTKHQVFPSKQVPLRHS